MACCVAVALLTPNRAGGPLPRCCPRQVAARARVHFIAYTHSDLLSRADIARLLVWTEKTEATCPGVFFLNLKRANNVRLDGPRSYRALKYALEEACVVTSSTHILVVGMPNVGKSSLIAPLSWEPTQKRKKKKSYHQPKVCDAHSTVMPTENLSSPVKAEPEHHLL